MEPEPRVKAGLWVSIALRLGDKDGRPGMVLRKGDPNAGDVLVVLHGREGMSVLSQVRGKTGGLAWMRATGPGRSAGMCRVAEIRAARQAVGWSNVSVSKDTDSMDPV